jgi:hypothetical protein
VFAVAAAVVGLAFVLSWALEQRPLRDTIAAGAGVGESFAVPKQGDSLAEVSRALTCLIGREGRRRIVERLAERAGVELSPAACWLIVRLHEDPCADVEKLCASYDIPAEVGARAVIELEQQQLVTPQSATATEPPALLPTAAGERTVAKLVAERRATLGRLLEGWAPEQQADVARLLTGLARELAAEPSAEVGARA